jgi:tRNA modification GTPase
MEILKDQIQTLAWSGQISGEMFEVMINSRHQEALERARQHLTDTLASFRNDATLELTAVDLRLATQAVGEIVGKTTTEDLLDSIFGQFCIGK